MPNGQDKIPPLLGGQFYRRRWRDARAVRNQLRRQPPVPDAAHLVGLPTLVADPLRAGSGICWVMAVRKSVAVKT